MDGKELGLLARVFMGLLKIAVVLLKLAAFTGLLWFALPIGLGLLIEIITGTPFTKINPVLFFLIDKVMWYAAFPLAALTLVQNLIRLAKKDRSFSIFRALLNMGSKKGFEASLKGEAVSLKSASDLSGMVFGKQGGKYVVQPESADGHSLIVGGAGSGKTAAIAIPTLMSWKDRVFAIDIKGELYEKTSKARNPAQIKVFNPTDRSAYRYDPFYTLRTGDDISSAARQLAMALVPLSADIKDPFWVLGAQNMLTGFLIYLCGLNENFSSSMQRIKGTPTRQLVAEILQSSNQKARMEIMQFEGMDDKTLSGIFAELSNHISIFATNDDLQWALSGEGACITPNDLETGYDIYCCIPEHKLDEWKDLLGMMCNQFLKAFERRPEGSNTPILFLIDEFPRLGKIEAISNGLATLRSKKIHIALIVQSKSQLNAIYGKDIAEVIADNCAYKAILKASEPATQEWCSKLVGTFDKKKTSSNYNADMIGIGKGQGTSRTTEEKNIIKPEEFAYLQDVVCLFPTGYKRLQKANYYEDKTFTSRM